MKNVTESNNNINNNDNDNEANIIEATNTNLTINPALTQAIEAIVSNAMVAFSEKLAIEIAKGFTEGLNVYDKISEARRLMHDIVKDRVDLVSYHEVHKSVLANHQKKIKEDKQKYNRVFVKAHTTAKRQEELLNRICQKLRIDYQPPLKNQQRIKRENTKRNK